ncbi:MAG: hypothetical protein SVG88_04070 [Halobacteriales archaeon]|nr:hypothetical protein [Halobacteriales archaeon]
MAETPARELSCDAKLARVVLANCGPLSPSEIAQEAYLSTERAKSGVEELTDAGLAEPVCGVCKRREEVFALTETAKEQEAEAETEDDDDSTSESFEADS